MKLSKVKNKAKKVSSKSRKRTKRLFKQTDLPSFDLVPDLGSINTSTGEPNPKSVEGYYLGYRAMDSYFGLHKLYILKTPKGDVGIFGKTNLDQKMVFVRRGAMVRISLIGEIYAGNRNYIKEYKVEVDEEDIIKTSTASNKNTTKRSQIKLNM